jgi:hypothetical protein
MVNVCIFNHPSIEKVQKVYEAVGFFLAVLQSYGTTPEVSAPKDIMQSMAVEDSSQKVMFLAVFGLVLARQVLYHLSHTKFKMFFISFPYLPNR